jgi:cellulose biosynthesis protein BcsQ
MTLVSENVFHASDTLLVPLVPTTLSLLTYEQLLRFFVKSDLDRSKISIFFSMVERRKSLHCGIMEKLSHMETGVLKTPIPYSSDIEKMGINREPVICFRPTSAAAQSYRDLWGEIKAVCLRNA